MPPEVMTILTANKSKPCAFPDILMARRTEKRRNSRLKKKPNGNCRRILLYDRFLLSASCIQTKTKYTENVAVEKSIGKIDAITKGSVITGATPKLAFVFKVRPTANRMMPTI